MSDPNIIHLEAQYVEYTDVIEKFTAERIQDRYHRLLESANEFIHGMTEFEHRQWV